MDWKKFLLGSLVSIIGITLISFGAALSESMNMGLDPFTAINRGASSLLGFSLGNFQLGVNLVILAIVFFMKKSLIGWGTIYNMVLVGYQVEFFNNLFGNFFTVEEMSLVIRIIITIAAIAIFAFGVAIYMDTELGVSPYDAITPLITDRTGWSYTPVRVAQDLIIVVGAYFLGGPVGIATIITGFFAGPLISFFSEKVSQPIIKKLSLNA
ncbi:YczE/YyaS/YitT family protein [Jeotgalibaca dankookensis]|uniref:YczE/YyaS/YitT family protein n=1 Tax=Jeotgalibaca dankookensis TaxID=708126 RepID=UPI000785F28B|nr:membrane protein [Jeotgalibaca dankookensis]